MSDLMNSASIYTDFNGLSELRARSGQGSPAAHQEVAQQFEALFIQTMLKSMRDASLAGSGAESDQIKFYQEMFDKQIALSLAEGQGIGLTAVFAQHLGNASGTTETHASPAIQKIPGGNVKPLVAYQAVAPSDDISRLDKQSAAVAASTATSVDPHWHPENPEEFIRELWPHAVSVADRLGVRPEVLIAQAALETGWGQKIIRDQQDRSSFNLFNIKVGRGWQGQQMTVATLEYRDGIAVREHASFRAYASLVEGMEDYVALLKNNPRYQTALENVANAEQYLHELQSAGYATDPRYAEKIGSILNRDTFNETVAELKVSQKQPLS